MQCCAQTLAPRQAQALSKVYCCMERDCKQTAKQNVVFHRNAAYLGKESHPSLIISYLISIFVTNHPNQPIFQSLGDSFFVFKGWMCRVGNFGALWVAFGEVLRQLSVADRAVVPGSRYEAARGFRSRVSFRRESVQFLEFRARITTTPLEACRKVTYEPAKAVVKRGQTCMFMIFS